MAPASETSGITQEQLDAINDAIEDKLEWPRITRFIENTSDFTTALTEIAEQELGDLTKKERAQVVKAGVAFQAGAIDKAIAYLEVMMEQRDE